MDVEPVLLIARYARGKHKNCASCVDVTRPALSDSRVAVRLHNGSIMLR